METLFIVDCSSLSLQTSIELIIFNPPSILDAEITLFSFLCSGLLSSDYVEIHYENGKPQYSKVWLITWKSWSINSIIELFIAHCIVLMSISIKLLVLLHKHTFLKIKVSLGEICEDLQVFEIILEILWPVRDWRPILKILGQ